MADVYKNTGKRMSISVPDDASTAAAARGFGGVYLGPGTDILTSGSPPARSGSQKKKEKKDKPPTPTSQEQRRESKTEEKYKEIAASSASAPVWGGVYVGPASDASAYQKASTAQDQQSQQISKDGEESGLGPASRLIRTLSKSKETRNSIRGGKVRCEICKKKCVGDVIRADDKHFHLACFTCKVCHCALGDVGYFVQDGDYYCPTDYHSKFGRKCPACNKFVEGDVVQLLDRTYHQQCFKCDRCRYRIYCAPNQ